MKWLRRLQQPRWLAALALAFALVPAWLALVTYRDARAKDERLFQTGALVVEEQLLHVFEGQTYLLSSMRSQAGSLDDAAVLSVQIMQGFVARGQVPRVIDWREKMRHLVAFGYAAQEEGRVIFRWKGDERAPVAAIGDDLSGEPAIVAAANGGTEKRTSLTFGTMDGRHRMLVAMTVLKLPARTTRGYVVGWIDLDSLCRDATVPLLRDGVISATPLAENEALPAGAARATIREGYTRWDVAIARGPKFNEHFGAPAPWLAFLAVGVSAVPLLVLASLAGRASRLRVALAAERELVRQQRFFTQSVSHEFRTPLGVILSGADLLESYDGQLTAERRSEVLGEIKDNTRHMNALIEQVLLLGRIESSRLECAPKRLELAALCEDIVRKVNTATHGRCAIAVTAPEREAMLDPTLLGSILGNLLSNAVKYSAPGQPVALEVSVDAARLTFVVRDEGIGIPADDVSRVGEIFHRSSNVGDAPGTGLGLAIAQRCTELHGGSLKLTSEVGRGTTVTVSIPNLD